jgi:hypothetical protein
MYNHSYRLMSPPLDLFWDGWRASTTSLMHGGWEFAVSHDEYSLAYEIVIKRKDLPMFGYGRIERERMETHSRRNFSEKPIAVKINMVKDVYYSGRPEDHVFRSVNMRPRWESEEKLMSGGLKFHSIEEFWVPSDVKPGLTKEIMLDQLSMDEVLKLALVKQEPAQERIRKRMLRDSRMNEMLKQGELPSTVKAQLRLIA